MGFPKALKTLEILEKPEVTFKRRLKSNPFYPFNNIGGNSKWISEVWGQKFYICSLSVVSYYYGRSKLAFLKVLSLSSWLVGVTRSSGYHLCFDLSSWFVNGRNFAVFPNQSIVNLKPDISRTLWCSAFCPFWISYIRFRIASFDLKHIIRITEVIFTKDWYHCKVDIVTHQAHPFNCAFFVCWRIFFSTVFCCYHSRKSQWWKKQLLFCFLF